MVLGQVQAEREILDGRQEPVAEVLPAWHPTGQWIAQEATAKHEVAAAGHDGRDEVRDPGRVVLVVGVEHDHDVGAGVQRRVVARLLVAAIATVLLVDDDVEPELAGHVHGLVAGHVVNEDDALDEVVRNVGVRALEGARGVVGRHDDDDARRCRSVAGGRGAGHPGRLIGGLHDGRVAYRHAVTVRRWP